MGRAPCCDKNGLKKGPWTPEEDQKLVDYIRKNGYGNWRTLPKNAGIFAYIRNYLNMHVSLNIIVHIYITLFLVLLNNVHIYYLRYLFYMCVGLGRCGKSCRLRWTNYLRPDIKRGRFSFEEEETIIQLHSVLGNK